MSALLARISARAWRAGFGFAVTVNVDNRTMSATSLTRELALLVEAFEYDLDDLETFQFNAASAAFLPVEEREELVEMIGEGFSG